MTVPASFIERHPADHHTHKRIEEWKQLQAGWDLTVVTDGRSLVAFGIAREQLCLFAEPVEVGV